MPLPPGPPVHVSVTEFRLRHRVVAPWFWLLAVRALSQARAAPGNLRATARTVDGVHHTLTVWTDRDAMRAYLTDRAHGQAMRASRWLGTGRTCGFDATVAPDWPEALATWRATARAVPAQGGLPK